MIDVRIADGLMLGQSFSHPPDPTKEGLLLQAVRWRGLWKGKNMFLFKSNRILSILSSPAGASVVINAIKNVIWKIFTKKKKNRGFPIQWIISHPYFWLRKFGVLKVDINFRAG